MTYGISERYIAKPINTADTWGHTLIGALHLFKSGATQCRFVQYDPADKTDLTSCQYLVKPDDYAEHYRWVKTSNGVVPDGAVVGGQLSDGTKLHIVHIEIGGSTLVNMSTFHTQGINEACGYTNNRKCQTEIYFLVYKGATGKASLSAGCPHENGDHLS